MAKHGGCYLCGSMDDETLIAYPFQAGQAMSVGLCHKCESLPAPELRRRLRGLEERRSELLRKAREELANG